MKYSTFSHRTHFLCTQYNFINCLWEIGLLGSNSQQIQGTWLSCRRSEKQFLAQPGYTEGMGHKKAFAWASPPRPRSFPQVAPRRDRASLAEKMTEFWSIGDERHLTKYYSCKNVSRKHIYLSFEFSALWLFSLLPEVNPMRHNCQYF